MRISTASQITLIPIQEDKRHGLAECVWSGPHGAMRIKYTGSETVLCQVRRLAVPGGEGLGFRVPEGTSGQFKCSVS